MKKLLFAGCACLALFSLISLNSIGQSADPNSMPPPPAEQMAPPPPEMAGSAGQDQNAVQMAPGSETGKPAVAEAPKKIKPIIPATLSAVPTNSEIIFKKDLLVPPNAHEVMVGSSNGAYRTECKIKLASASSSLRMVPAGTKFKILDTRLGFGSGTDLVVESASIAAYSCISFKPSDPSQLMSTEQFKETNYYQANAASGGVVKIELNSKPELIVN